MSFSWNAFVPNRLKIFLVVSLIATWTIAHMMPVWTPVIKSTLSTQFDKYRAKIPNVKIDFHPNSNERTAYNTSKLALIIEPRPIPSLVPQILHMMSVVPADWRFMMIGSNESVLAVGRSYAIQYQITIGKMDLLVAPNEFPITPHQALFSTLTNLSFYDQLMPTVEWLLKYESDAILCSNSADSVDNWLHYDWAGAPRTKDDRFAGNGGLSLRRLSAVRKVLSFQVRESSASEDEWFGNRLVHYPGMKVATGKEPNHFSMEEVYHPNPLGIHLRKGNDKLPKNVWKNKDQRAAIFKYCPEVSMIMDMKFESERCEGDDREGTLAASTSSSLPAPTPTPKPAPKIETAPGPAPKPPKAA